MERKSSRQYLEENVWPLVPSGELGRVTTREEEDQILGYGPEGC
jgi:antitoxin VapB